MMDRQRTARWQNGVRRCLFFLFLLLAGSPLANANASPTLQPPVPGAGEPRSNPQAKNAPNPQHTSAGQGTAQPITTIPANQLSPIKPQGDTKEQATREKIKAAEDWWIMVGTVGSGAFAGMLFFVAVGQAVLFFQQLRLIKDSQRDTTLAAEAAIKAAIAAENSVTLAKDTAERQLRAYVLISGAKLVFGTLGVMPFGRVEIKNSGQTPAYKVRVWYSIWIETHPLSIVLPVPQGNAPRAVSILPNGGTLYVDTVRLVPQSAHITGLIGTPDATIYVYGQITYFDAFEHGRTTDFRLIYGGPEGSDANGLMSADTEGNDAT